MNRRNRTTMRLFTLMGRKGWGYGISIVLGGIGGISIPLMTSIILKYTLDSVSKRNYALFEEALFGVGVAVLLLFENNVCSYLVEKYAKQMMGNIRMRVFQHVEHLRMSYFDSHHSGDLVSRMTNDMDVVNDGFSMEFGYFYSVVLSGVVSVGTMLIFDWRLGIIGVVIGVISTFVNKSFAKPMRQLGQQVQQTIGKITTIVTDMLAGIGVLRMFHGTPRKQREFNEVSDMVTSLEERRAHLNGLLNGLNQSLQYASFIGMLLVGIFFMHHGSTSIGIVVAIIQLQGSVTGAFSEIGSSIASMQQSLAGADRLFDILDEPKEPEYVDGSERSTNPSTSMIELRDIHFSYGREDSKQVLNGLSLAVSKGEVVAIVGPSGQGKSTLFKLLMGFYPIDRGNINIIQRGIGEYSLTQLRDMIAYVPQDAYLFTGTVEDNIRYGNILATRSAVIEAAMAANAHDFITGLPQGYDTSIGERGNHLSGGQRQRIAIARAILKNAPILLLDEATSALDNQSEALVQQALERLMHDRTTLIIAHRLSTIERADVIYVISEGRVVEQGNHNELLQKKGLYANLHNHQADGLKTII